MLGHIAEYVAVLSIIGHFVQYHWYKTKEKVVLGFLHGLKPTIQSAATGGQVPTSLWQAMVEQVNDMLSRLQPPEE